MKVKLLFESLVNVSSTAGFMFHNTEIVINSAVINWNFANFGLIDYYMTLWNKCFKLSLGFYIKNQQWLSGDTAPCVCLNSAVAFRLTAPCVCMNSAVAFRCYSFTFL
jgi:hypothetical protein